MQGRSCRSSAHSDQTASSSGRCSAATPSSSCGPSPPSLLSCASYREARLTPSTCARRTSLQLAELEREGGISPRISPMTGAPVPLSARRPRRLADLARSLPLPLPLLPSSSFILARRTSSTSPLSPRARRLSIRHLSPEPRRLRSLDRRRRRGPDRVPVDPRARRRPQVDGRGQRRREPQEDAQPRDALGGRRDLQGCVRARSLFCRGRALLGSSR